MRCKQLPYSNQTIKQNSKKQVTGIVNSLLTLASWYLSLPVSATLPRASITWYLSLSRSHTDSPAQQST